MHLTISITIGKGSIAHNRREFHTPNVDVTRSHLNIEYCHEKIKTVYHELFDESVKKYNDKQTRKDRKIDDYFEKIRTGKQEKTFHEIVVQIGNKDTCAATSDIGELAAKILEQYLRDFVERNTTLRVFSAHLHMDESTPHLHIDFIPFTTKNNNRGPDTRVSLKQALASLGFIGEGREHTEFCKWKEAEERRLASIMKEHGIEWEKKDTHEKHLSVLDYKKEKRIKEIAELEEVLERIREQKIDLEKIEKVEVKTIPLSNKVLIDSGDLDILMLASKKLMLQETEKDELKKELEKVKKENDDLSATLDELSERYNGIADQMSNITDLKIQLYSLEKENKKLYENNRVYEAFIKENALVKSFKEYKNDRKKEREWVR